jgi:hypothetical protein
LNNRTILAGLGQEASQLEANEPVKQGLLREEITWFLVQLLGRSIQTLDTSILEIFTLGIINRSLITCGFWRRKPLDVRVPIVLEITTAQLMNTLRTLHRYSRALGLFTQNILLTDGGTWSRFTSTLLITIYPSSPY